MAAPKPEIKSHEKWMLLLAVLIIGYVIVQNGTGGILQRQEKTRLIQRPF
jgi:hypothetical protein